MKPWSVLAAALIALQISSAVVADESSDRRAEYLALIDRPRAPLKPELAALPPVEGLKKFHLWFSSDASERVPGYLLLPDQKKFKGRRPVVVVLHGTGNNKENGQIADIVLTAARAGFIGVAIDGRFHGERTRAGNGAAEYNEAIAQAFRSGQGHPLYYDTTWDVMRLIDYLETRKDVDAARIGLTGISKGGIETYLTAAADPRVAVAVSYIGVQSFAWGLENGQWRARVATFEDGFEAAAKSAGKSPRSADFAREFYQRVAPGIDGKFDGGEMLRLISPRPFLFVNGDSDANTPIGGVRQAAEVAHSKYAADGKGDNLVLIVQVNTPHRVNPSSIDAGIAWFVRWLTP
jgi:dienelactone hydrolase